MTLEKCQKVLDDLRRSQGTGNPLVRVACGGTVFLGRLARSDSPGAPGRVGTPYGVIVLEAPGLARAPETILQIADIPDDGIRALERAS